MISIQDVIVGDKLQENSDFVSIGDFHVKFEMAGDLGYLYRDIQAIYGYDWYILARVTYPLDLKSPKNPFHPFNPFESILEKS